MIMILTQMLKLCKKKKIIQIISYGGCTFLSDGSTAGYIDEDTEDWTAEDCAAAIGIPEDVREGYILAPARRLAIELAEMDEAIPMRFPIANGQPFMLKNGSVFFVKKEKLSVFDEVQNVRYFVGGIDDDDTEPKLVITNNDFPVGVITPESVNLSKMKAYAQELYTGLDISEKNSFFDAGGQMEIEEPSEAESEGTE